MPADAALVTNRRGRRRAPLVTVTGGSVIVLHRGLHRSLIRRKRERLHAGQGGNQCAQQHYGDEM